MLSRRSLMASAALLAGLILCPAPVLAGEQSGFAYGAWDQPPNSRDAGWLYGYLFEAPSYEIQYLFIAELQERPGAITIRAGPIYGLLYETTGGFTRPVYYVDGRWFGAPGSGVGSWTATLYSLDTLLPVGQMRGDFNDPAPSQIGRWGEFSGSYQIRD